MVHARLKRMFSPNFLLCTLISINLDLVQAEVLQTLESWKFFTILVDDKSLATKVDIYGRVQKLSQ